MLQKHLETAVFPQWVDILVVLHPHRKASLKDR